MYLVLKTLATVFDTDSRKERCRLLYCEGKSDRLQCTCLMQQDTHYISRKPRWTIGRCTNGRCRLSISQYKDVNSKDYRPGPAWKRSNIFRICYSCSPYWYTREASSVSDPLAATALQVRNSPSPILSTAQIYKAHISHVIFRFVSIEAHLLSRPPSIRTPNKVLHKCLLTQIFPSIPRRN